MLTPLKITGQLLFLISKFKIISKILTDRLALVAARIISANQYACRVDRFKIALVLLLKLLTYFIKNVRGDNVAYKVDIYKAFDTLS